MEILLKVLIRKCNGTNNQLEKISGWCNLVQLKTLIEGQFALDLTKVMLQKNEKEPPKIFRIMAKSMVVMTRHWCLGNLTQMLIPASHWSTSHCTFIEPHFALVSVQSVHQEAPRVPKSTTLDGRWSSWKSGQLEVPKGTQKYQKIPQVQRKIKTGNTVAKAGNLANQFFAQSA